MRLSRRPAHEIAFSCLLWGAIPALSAVFPAASAHAQGTPPAAAAPAVAAPVAAAPVEYETMPLDEKLGRQKSEIRRMLVNGVSPADNQRFEDYYVKFEIARWTHKDHFPKLPAYRKAFQTDLSSTRGGPAHAKLAALLKDQMVKIVKGNYAPASKVNAMLMLGELNVRPPRPGEAAQPLPETLPILLDAIDDAKQSDAVRVAAILGVQRHAELGVASPQDQQRVVQAMLKLATAKSAPAHRTPAGHDWMRRSALECLGVAKLSTPDPNVPKTLVAVLDEATASLAVRRSAATALGSMKLTAADGLVPAQLIGSLARLARDAFKEEVDRSKAKNEPINAAMLKTTLVAAHVGLTGSERTSSAATGGVGRLAVAPADLSALNKLRDKLKKWLNLLDDPVLSTKTAAPAAGEMGMGPGAGFGGLGGFGGPGAGGAAPAVETPAQAASKKIVEEIEKDIEAKDFADLLAPAAK